MAAVARVLPWISSWSIRHLWASGSQGLRTIFGHYSNRIGSGNFSFDYCDVLAEFSRRAVNETDDTDVLRDAIRSLVELGYHHNRWHVRDVVTTILQTIRKTEPALASIEALRTADREAVKWAISDFSLRSLPPVLRNGIQDLMSSVEQ